MVEAFLSWADARHPQNGDRLIRALKYINGCRPYMINCLQDGRCSLSSNLSENSLRPLVVGRNWLFSDTQDGAETGMVIYSMIETARANNIDPLKYLTYLLEKRPGAICRMKTWRNWSHGMKPSKQHAGINEAKRSHSWYSSNRCQLKFYVIP